MIIGVKNVVCTCGKEMIRTGGVFGGDGPPTDTYYCSDCEKYVVIITPKSAEQKEFAQKIRR